MDIPGPWEIEQFNDVIGERDLRMPNVVIATVYCMLSAYLGDLLTDIHFL
jgi:hypothetical protein